MADYAKLTQQQRLVWEQSASRYDRQIALLERIWLRGGREWLGARATGTVLDVGIGTGRNLSHLRAATMVNGIDLSPSMLRHARGESERCGVAVNLVEGDAAALPYASNTFDTVICALALCSIPEPVRALAEMHRVLRVGGQLLLWDHIRSSWPPIFAAQLILEQVTRRAAGEHFTRRHRGAVESLGLHLEESERLQAGTIERIRAIKTSALETSA